jgi:hypothetical protein
MKVTKKKLKIIWRTKSRWIFQKIIPRYYLNWDNSTTVLNRHLIGDLQIPRPT